MKKNLLILKKGKAGTILNNNFVIGCKDKSIKIIEIQKEGKNKLLLEYFLQGINFKIGDLTE
jgi:methionyl-tRNA formyltransferase